MMLGPYGDIVQYADGTTYLSWYPACLEGWSTDLVRPAQWEPIVRCTIGPDDSLAIARKILEMAARDWIQGLAGARPLGLGGCVICGAGHLNIDHARSGLHSRIEAGVLSLGGYHSVNTGKFTTAPMFASSVARRVLAFAQSGEAAQGDR